MQRDEIAILGAGLSGVTVARMLHDRGFGVAVFEKEDTIGGMCQSVETKYGTVDTVGFHVFNTNRKDVRDWVFSVYPEKNWRFNERNAKVWMTLR